MSKQDLTEVSAVDAAEAIRAGRLSSAALTEACLERIAETDPQLQAWAALDVDYAMDQALEMDRVRKSGRATGNLHGVPVGLKDIIDTCDLPTERGSIIFEGRRPKKDAAIVERLRDAGAVILGKTRTTELAFVHPTTTRNPHDPSRTPGGSSSGSAAAVAARQVPLAIGTQTNGSVIRPASFCGTYGFKPTRGVISRRGVLQTSVSLDQVGVFGRSLEDVALLSHALGAYDPIDPLSFARPRPDTLAGARSEPPVEPDIAFFDLPYHDRLTPDAREGIEAVIEVLGDRVERFGVAPQLADLLTVQATIHEYEILQHLGDVFDADLDRISTTLQAVIERARKISEEQFAEALEIKTSAEKFFADHFNDFDAILSPSATGEAPMISDGGTGDPAFSTIWTLAGLPALTVPALVGENGLPIGVQLIGNSEEDDRLMRTAAWAQRQLLQTNQTEEN